MKLGHLTGLCIGQCMRWCRGWCVNVGKAFCLATSLMLGTIYMLSTIFIPSTVLMLGTMSSAHAYEAQPYETQPLMLAEASVSLEQAIRSVRTKYNAKVLSATEIQSKGPLVYKVKILLPSGRVRTVFVDGQTGAVFEG